MADPLTYLKQRSEDDWLIGYDSQEFFAVAERMLAKLRSRLQPEIPLTVLLAERNPLTFLAHLIAACAANCQIFLANPDWADAEWQQVFELVTPDVVWGDRALDQWRTAETQRRGDGSRANASDPSPFTLHPLPLILIPTGGTSGKIRFAIHTWKTLMASVQGFREYFEVDQVNSFCVLPLYHVSGLMQFLRSFTTGGKLVVLPFKALEAGNRSPVDPEAFFLSLVPTQLERLMGGKEAEEQTAEMQRRRETAFTQSAKLSSQAPYPTPHTRSAERSRRSSRRSPHPIPHASIAFLSRFHTVLLGGAPAWSDLLDRARTHRIRLAPTYGMTETASQIATLKPEDFLNGHTNSGQILPHAQITIRCPSGSTLSPHQIGSVTIQAKSLALGYYPPTPHSSLPTPELFQPDDLGYFDTDGYLHIVGRQSAKIITGGENVYPAEVEAAIRSTALVQDVCVVGVSDRQWGQAITAVYVPIDADIPTAVMQTALEDKLSKFKRPKHWLAVDQLPRNAQGKVNRSHIEAIAKHRLSSVPTID